MGKRSGVPDTVEEASRLTDAELDKLIVHARWRLGDVKNSVLRNLARKRLEMLENAKAARESWLLLRQRSAETPPVVSHLSLQHVPSRRRGAGPLDCLEPLQLHLSTALWLHPLLSSRSRHRQQIESAGQWICSACELLRQLVQGPRCSDDWL